MVITNTSTLRITINLASQRAVQPNSPPTLSLSFNAFCSKAQVKLLFVSEIMFAIVFLLHKEEKVKETTHLAVKLLPKASRLNREVSMT